MKIQKMTNNYMMLNKRNELSAFKPIKMPTNITINTTMRIV